MTDHGASCSQEVLAMNKVITDLSAKNNKLLAELNELNMPLLSVAYTF